MSAVIALTGVAALVIALVLVSRRLDPIGGEASVTHVTHGDADNEWNGWVRDDSRATPLPRSEPVATRFRAWLSRHVVSRHESGPDVAHAESPDGESDGGDVEGPVRGVADGVHIGYQPMDEWLRERIGQAPYSRASLAQAAAREYRCSLRTAQRALARLIDGGRK